MTAPLSTMERSLFHSSVSCVGHPEPNTSRPAGGWKIARSCPAVFSGRG